MRYPASEKLEIIRLVEGSHLSARLTLAKLGIPRTTFYRWYDRYLQRGEAGLKDQSPKLKVIFASGLRSANQWRQNRLGLSTRVPRPKGRHPPPP